MNPVMSTVYVKVNPRLRGAIAGIDCEYPLGETFTACVEHGEIMNQKIVLSVQVLVNTLHPFAVGESTDNYILAKW